MRDQDQFEAKESINEIRAGGISGNRISKVGDFNGTRARLAAEDENALSNELEDIKNQIFHLEHRLDAVRHCLKIVNQPTLSETPQVARDMMPTTLTSRR